MKINGRRIFFWSLVALFFVAAPSVVLYARGYRLDPSRGIVVHSGSITIKSNPSLVDIKLNDKVNESKTLNRVNNSYNLNGLLPGSYNISISAPGFQSWSKKWDVHSGVSTEFWNTLLVRNDYVRKNYDTAGVKKFYVSPKDDLIALAKSDDNGLNISVLDISDNSIKKSYDIPGWDFIGDDYRENIEWSPDEKYLSVPVKKELEIINDQAPKTKGVETPRQQQETRYGYFVADIDNSTSFDLNEFLAGSDVKEVRWDPREEGYLFFMKDGSIYRTNINDKNDINMVVSDVSAYDLSGSTLYYIQKANNLVFKTSLDGLSERSQVTNDFPESGETIEKMIVYSDKEIALIGADRDFYAYNSGEHDTYFRKLGTGVLGSHFSNDGKKLLFWTDNEISVYFARDWLVQPLRNENELTNITRYSEPIKNVQWFKDYEHVIFSSGRYVKIIELDPRDHRNTSDLLNTKAESPSVIYNDSLEYLFFTDDSSENGQSQVQSIIFPEPTPLLGFGG